MLKIEDIDKVILLFKIFDCMCYQSNRNLVLQRTVLVIGYSYCDIDSDNNLIGMLWIYFMKYNLLLYSLFQTLRKGISHLVVYS